MRRWFWILLSVALGYAAWSARERFVPPAPAPIAAPPGDVAPAPAAAPGVKTSPARSLPSAEIDDESRRELERILREAEQGDPDEARRR